MKRRTVLLTGATGYIASHTWLDLLAAGYDVVGIDDFSNSLPEVLTRIERLAGTKPVFERADVCDTAALSKLFRRALARCRGAFRCAQGRRVNR